MEMCHIIYIGYYVKSHQLLCVSTNKQLVINYMENHRGLTSKNYYIEKEKSTETEILLKFDKYVISEYNGYYIPNIDQCIIDIAANTLPENIITTIEQLKEITLLSSNVKQVSKNDFETLVNSIKILNSFIKKSKIINKLNKEYCITHSILFCDIDEYLKKLRIYREMKDFDKSFNNALADF